MGRRERIRTAAAITAAAALAVALVVVGTAGAPWDSLMTSGTVALEPTLVAPGRPSTPEPTTMPRTVIEVPGGGGSTSAAGHLGVSVGSVGGLYPGHRLKLGVRYVNPYSFPIVLDTVTVRAHGTAQCTARQLMRPRTPHLRLPSHSSVASTIKVGMKRSAPDACQGVRFSVHVRVTAVKL